MYEKHNADTQQSCVCVLIASLNDFHVFSLHSSTGAGENTKQQLVSVRNKISEPFLPSFFKCVSQHEGKNTQLSLGSLSIGLLR